jgi:hypothetical protein
VGLSEVDKSRINVVFPAPLSPKRPKTRPALHSMLTESTARISPLFLSWKIFVRLLVVIIESMPSGRWTRSPHKKQTVENIWGIERKGKEKPGTRDSHDFFVFCLPGGIDYAQELEIGFAGILDVLDRIRRDIDGLPGADFG